MSQNVTQLKVFIDRVVVLCPTQHKTGYFWNFPRNLCVVLVWEN